MEYRWSMGFPTRAWSGPASAVPRKQSPRLLSEVSSLSRSWKRGSAPWEARKGQEGFRACSSTSTVPGTPSFHSHVLGF